MKAFLPAYGWVVNHKRLEEKVKKIISYSFSRRTKR
jgi:hypothetical protein